MGIQWPSFDDEDAPSFDEEDLVTFPSLHLMNFTVLLSQLPIPMLQNVVSSFQRKPILDEYSSWSRLSSMGCQVVLL